MFMFLVWATLLGFIFYILIGFAKQADELEDDARHLYENHDRDAYGTKFIQVLGGKHGDGR